MWEHKLFVGDPRRSGIIFLSMYLKSAFQTICSGNRPLVLIKCNNSRIVCDPRRTRIWLKRMGAGVNGESSVRKRGTQEGTDQGRSDLPDLELLSTLYATAVEPRVLVGNNIG